MTYDGSQSNNHKSVTESFRLKFTKNSSNRWIYQSHWADVQRSTVLVYFGRSIVDWCLKLFQWFGGFRALLRKAVESFRDRVPWSTTEDQRMNDFFFKALAYVAMYTTRSTKLFQSCPESNRMSGIRSESNRQRLVSESNQFDRWSCWFTGKYELNNVVLFMMKHNVFNMMFGPLFQISSLNRFEIEFIYWSDFFTNQFWRLMVVSNLLLYLDKVGYVSRNLRASAWPDSTWTTLPSLSSSSASATVTPRFWGNCGVIPWFLEEIIGIPSGTF